MSDFDRLQATIGQWARVTFPGQSLGSIISHLREEWDELEAVFLESPIDAGLDAIEEEAADMQILLFALADHCGFSLKNATVVKQSRNLGRRWGPPDARGVHHHTEDEER